MLPFRALRPVTRNLSHARRARLDFPSRCLLRPYSQKAKSQPDLPVDPPDHRKLGNQQELFTTSIYSPGSPIFLPNGTRIFNRLVDFLRKQYVYYGFDEVITPNIYKKSLWEVSGHLQNYADDMYTVTSRSRKPESASCCGDRDLPEEGNGRSAEGEDDDYGLKPMNCPGHCLIFASKTRSYRDLPIRYADFSPLHRNEISGALTGLTRVRRFHQDDGHIFCRPIQVREEVFRTLDFMKSVYGALGLGQKYEFALSTRPADHYIGTEEEWDAAEGQLRGALEQAGLKFEIREGDGAFYGPKIDVILKDSHGKTHQAGTIQLDFQLPQRFGLEYQAPAPEAESQGKSIDDAAVTERDTYGPVTPVLIHRAILGSVERLMALLIEEYNGKWPFWLNPRQCIVLTLNDTAPVVERATEIRAILRGDKFAPDASSYGEPTGLAVDMDASARPLAQKVAEAKEKQYGFIAVVGGRDVEKGTVTVDGGSTDPLQKQARPRREEMTPEELRAKMKALVEAYA